MLRALFRRLTGRRPAAQPAPPVASIFDLVGTSAPVRKQAARPADVPPASPASEPERRVLEIKNRFSSVEHYYHFLLGFFTPLVLGPVLRNPGIVYRIRSCGPMNAHIHALALPNIDIVEKKHWFDLLRTAGATAERISGFDDPAHYDGAAFARLRDILLDRFGINPSAQEDGVLFIDRGDSPAYYQSEESEVKTSANLRRTVPNMADLAQGLNARGVAARIARLETMPLPEQIALFARHRILIAQHGAALANVIWMPAGSAVVEINPMPPGSKFREYFRHLAASCGHRYEVVEQVSSHAPVDAADIDAALSAVRPV